MSKIFISYRRDDATFHAKTLRDLLADNIGGEHIFMDIDNVEPGEDFVEVIQEKVGACDVLLAVIGKSWLACVDKAGQRRLDSPDDFVRLEIEAALERKIRVIPVLVGGATVPASTDLPDAIKLLARRNAIKLDDLRFRDDVQRLLETVKKVISPQPPVDTINSATITPEVKVHPKNAAPIQSRPLNGPLINIVSHDFSVFRDRLNSGGESPEMVRIPAGQFRMGDLSGNGEDHEKPVHVVNIARPIAIGRFAVTVEEFGKFFRSAQSPWDIDDDWQDRRPVTNVNWFDVNAYLRWLCEETGKRYRLPSEAEWEYTARAGTDTEYWWGNDIGTNRANGYRTGSPWSGNETAPVGSFEPNPWGLYDTAGNVWEWVQDVWHDNYEGAPMNGSAWESGDTAQRVHRGGSWGYESCTLRSAFRGRNTPDSRDDYLGFRLAQDL